MSGTHGDLFREIGNLVLAAHAGQSIDLAAKSEELAERYGNLDMPAELIAKAIARSLSAISVSMAIVSNGHDAHEMLSANGNGPVNGANGNGRANGHHDGNGRANGANGHAEAEALEPHMAEKEGDTVDAEPAENQAEAASALFPSGLRLAVLS